MSKNLKIINARENNLKNISLEIPHDCLTVVTGLSGSGKSSLAFDTVYAEGQRRYLETFNSYTRQFFDLVKRPDADLIQNVRPAIAIEQKTKIRSSRSTVGSVSGINDFLKVVWNFLAEPVCPKCDVKIDLTTAKEAAIRLENILKYNDSSVFVIIAAIKLPEEEKSKTKKNPKIAEVERLKVLGVTRCLNTETGEIFELDSLDKPSLKKLSVINLVIERVKHNSHSQLALSRAIEKAYSLATNRCLLIEQSANLDKSRRSLLRIINSPSQQNIKTTNRRIFEFRLIPDCTFEDVSLKSKRPSLFSYNHPYGACEECRGFGSILIVTSELCVPDLSKSISNGALHCWSGDSASGQLKKLIHFCDKHQINIDIPWKKLDQSHKDLIFNHNTSEYRGVLAWFKGLERKLYKTHVRIFISRFRKEIPCPSCLGKRLNKSALSYRIQTLNITEINSQPISDLLPWIEELQTHTKKLPKQIENIFEEVLSRLHYLNEVGLSYLTLNRQSNTLSGGETQRVNLAAAIGSNLTSTQFVLDEPTVGLHPRDTHRLIKAVQQLKDKGNSILVVEHDLDFIDSADNIIEIGPQAGNKGGEVIYSGPKNEWKPIALDKIPLVNFFEQESSKFISIKNANTRNLKDISLKIPLGKLIALTGVSGSGKSTILKEVILKGYEELKSDRKLSSASSIEGFSEIGEVVLVDQSAISRTPRGNIATYIGIWDEVRNLFAATEEAQTRRLSKSSFSFNVDAGRCTACKGAGFIREDMQFLSDVYIPCDTCLGKRFQQIVLEVTFQSKSIADILELSIEETGTFFKNSKAISRAVETLCSLGLGYLRLGHPLSELSGGEAQRLKLVSFITGNNSKKSLLLFDEPTTGLHVNDVVRLVTLFRNLIESGHSILCVEHNLTLIEACDWLIDMGPEGGEGGGRILFEGLPNKLSTTPQISYTAKYLNLHQNRFNSKLKKVSEKTNK
ncbi:MAG: excinuclease ABC subunit UvrA, partial [bacterium]|nr:excinuclease ABC subunit UvrA [bacterium]